MNRLAIIKTDHHPNIPYKIKDVHEATRFILQGAAIQAPALVTTSPSSSQTTGGNEYLKTETFASMMAEFTKTMNEALSYTRPRGSSNRTSVCRSGCRTGKKTETEPDSTDVQPD